MKRVELLAPAGDMNKLKTALHFGADAVYVGGSKFSLRANAKNFGENELAEAVKYTHDRGKKIYVATNVFADNSDFDGLKDYFASLYDMGVDAVIISDPGVLSVCREVAPNFEIHLSTQANTTNKYSAKFWAEQGVKRIVLARETSMKDIKEIREFLPEQYEIEAFVHGAMCIAYSGRCLLSNALTGRSSNKGDCVQACRWEYSIVETNRGGNPITIGQEERGTYLLNSKDLNMIEHIGELAEAGVYSFKIEGRMKSPYYVASVVNAYRQAIDLYYAEGKDAKLPQMLIDELYKNSHRDYTTGFYFGDRDTVCLETSQPKCDYEFIAEVKGYDEKRGLLIVEMRNRFALGDELEVLSASREYLNKALHIEKMYNEEMLPIDDAKIVQQLIYIPTDMKLLDRDILRKKVAKNSK
ncbi:MAG: U32 family peptidase [Clostridia bacterium]|nr:U32 family peptidase [Clostridia bacterium]